MAPKVWIGTEAAHEAVVPAGEDHVGAVSVARVNGSEEDVQAPEFRSLDGARVATISLPEGIDLIGALTEVGRVVRSLVSPCTVCNGTGVDETDEPGCQHCHGAKVESVTWVASDNEALEGLLAEQFHAARGVPADVEDTHYTENGPAGENIEAVTVGPESAPATRPTNMGSGGSSGGLTGPTGPGEPQHHSGDWGRYTGPIDVDGHEHFRRWTDHDGIRFLRTAAGRDFQSRVMGDTASTGTGSYAAANYIALTESSTAPADSDTALSGELVDSGLARAQATYAHVAGANTYTLTKTFTSGTATARTPAKIGVLNASSGGTLVFTTLITNPPPLQLGDSITITETVTIT
jgi:hypothetical protein